MAVHVVGVLLDWEGLVDHSAACTSCCISVPEADAHHAEWLCCHGMGMGIVAVTLLIPGYVSVGFCLTGLSGGV
jgi:hypothetical protein